MPDRKHHRMVNCIINAQSLCNDLSHLFNLNTYSRILFIEMTRRLPELKRHNHSTYLHATDQVRLIENIVSTTLSVIDIRPAPRLFTMRRDIIPWFWRWYACRKWIRLGNTIHRRRELVPINEQTNIEGLFLKTWPMAYISKQYVVAERSSRCISERALVFIQRYISSEWSKFLCKIIWLYDNSKNLVLKHHHVIV